MSALTSAQKRGLALLAHPGTVARGGSPSRWRVFDARGDEIGSVHSESLRALRAAGYVAWFHDVQPPDVCQRITVAGREYMTSRPRSTGAGGAA